MLKSLEGLNWVFILSLVVAVETQIGNGSMSLTNMFPDAWIPFIKAWSANLGSVGALIVAGGSYGKSYPSAANAQTVAKVLIAAIAFSLFMLTTGPASADPIADAKAKVAAFNKGVVTANKALVAPTPAPTITTSIDQFISKLEGVQAKLVTDVVADIQAADADAGTVIIPATATTPATVKDAVSHACYPAAIQFLKSLPTATPLTGTLTGVQLFQQKRDFITQLQAGLPSYLKVGCAALLGDEIKTFVTLMAMVGVTIGTGGVTGLLPAATLLPAIPALTIP